MVDFVRTDEQAEIVKAAGEFKKLKIDAKAGSGKTSTLQLLAEEFPVRSLYITFNKNMQKEASKKFPSHVEVKTTHSLAYSKFGAPLAHKLTRPKGAYQNVCGTGAEIARFYKIAPFVVTADKSISGTAMGYAVKSTLAKFEFSDDDELMEKHVSFYEADKVMKLPEFMPGEYAKRVLGFAKKLWKERINIKSPIQATHDTYLKLFQLSKPDLSQYEILYVDEAHDSSSCLMDIIHNHDGRVILVGDPYQAIYAWRGAINAMENTDWETRYLTKSFRFGPKVAEVARTILIDDDGNKFVNVVGYEALDTQVVVANKSNKYTWIFRTNAELIGNAVELIEKGKKINIEVDVADFRSMLLSALALRSGETKNVKHHEIVSFNSWQEFEEDVEVSSKGELKRIYNYIKGGVANKILRALDNYKPCKDADITLITAHKAKGLEFDNVLIGSDFVEFKLDDDGNWEGWHTQERNLLYVAVTRAKKTLVLSSMLQDLLSWYKRKDMKYLRVENPRVLKYDPTMKLDLESEIKMKAMQISGIIPTELEDWLLDVGVEAQEWDDQYGDQDDERQIPHRRIDGSYNLMPDIAQLGLPR